MEIPFSTRQLQVISFRNGGAYPTDVGFLLAFLIPILDEWDKNLIETEERKQLEAFKAAPETATKKEILNSTGVKK